MRWLTGVCSIPQDGHPQMGVSFNGNVFWDCKPIVVRNGITLNHF